MKGLCYKPVVYISITFAYCMYNKWIHFYFSFLSATDFLINIESFLHLVPIVIETQHYFCTYKLSQDHLELLFNAIRRAGIFYLLAREKMWMFLLARI